MVVASFLGFVFVGGGCSGPERGAPTPSAKVGFGDRDGPPAGSVSPTSAGSVSPAPAVSVAEAFFRTPSRNIVCVLTQESVRCDIRNRSWRPIPKPADCGLGWGNGLYVGKTGEAGFTCAGDTVLTSSRQTLEYGHALRAGDLICDSESAGVRCSNEASGHGFTLSAQEYSFF
jgi:uncharacterized protein DUF6636